jgi:hypothetical protein
VMVMRASIHASSIRAPQDSGPIGRDGQLAPHYRAADEPGLAVAADKRKRAAHCTARFLFSASSWVVRP